MTSVETGFIQKKESHSSVFETTHIISSKTLSEYADFPFSPEVADYPSHEELRNYFQSYAKHFDLYSCIEFNTLVKSCSLLDNQRWEIVTVCDKKKKKELFTDLVVCNGHHWEPNTLNTLENLQENFYILISLKRPLRLKTSECSSLEVEILLVM